MSVTVVVGSQWGDEAKGKVVDLLSEEADIVGRFNGGDNAGHTVINSYGTFKLRLTPNGFSNPDTMCVIGPGVVINLETLIFEMELIRSRGIDLANRYWISPRCHVVMPYHPLLEAIYEKEKGSSRTGTTGRGMGPVYADKVSYNGIRLYDLMDEAALRERLLVQLAIKNPILQAFNVEPLDLEAVLREKLAQFEIVRPVVRESFGMLQEALNRGANVVLEGAQAALLDNDWGTYPYCTASNTLAGGVSAGLGIGPRWIQRVIGVAKAYTTRVGAGPMPTELLDAAGDALRNAGQEFGTVTGRPRRCGWFDAELVRFTAQLNSMTEITLTKLDVLDTLTEVKICTAYRRKGDTQGTFRSYWEGDARWLEDCEPVYLEMEGWRQSTRPVRNFGRLPNAAQAYVRKVEELIGVPVTMVAVGPEREAIIHVPPMM